MEDNLQYNLALKCINRTNLSLFLTGKAGTGKTTFLKNLCETCEKKFVVVAPTGIAAINAGGVTINSIDCIIFNRICILATQITTSKTFGDTNIVLENIKTPEIDNVILTLSTNATRITNSNTRIFGPYIYAGYSLTANTTYNIEGAYITQ
jgi:predicted ATPase